MLIDLRKARLEDLIGFVFQHPVAEPEWYFTEDFEVEYDPETQVRLLTQLFSTPAVLSERFSPEQIEQGLWFIFNRNEPCFTELLWTSEVAWPRRDACIAAIYHLYADLFPRTKVETIDYMITDLLADGYGHGLRDPAGNAEDRRVQEALLQLFQRLLGQPDPTSQYAGLHGLGHLAHPEGSRAIRTYLDRNPGLSVKLRQYASEAIAGDVL